MVIIRSVLCSPLLPQGEIRHSMRCNSSKRDCSCVAKHLLPGPFWKRGDKIPRILKLFNKFRRVIRRTIVIFLLRENKIFRTQPNKRKSPYRVCRLHVLYFLADACSWCDVLSKMFGQSRQHAAHSLFTFCDAMRNWQYIYCLLKHSLITAPASYILYTAISLSRTCPRAA
jgi:hypothetical protein